MFLNLFQTIRVDGLRPTFRKAFSQLTRQSLVDDFDVRNQTDTSGVVPVWKLKIESPNAGAGTRYQPTTEQEFVDAIRFIQEDLITMSFVDLGCGKAKALLLAAGLGFKQVIGVEFALELVKVANLNLKKLKTSNALVFHLDAAEFCFPDTDMVVYLYNPFSEEVMRKVVVNLRKVARRKLYVVYNNARCAEVLDSSGFLTRLGSPPGSPHILIWSVNPDWLRRSGKSEGS